MRDALLLNPFNSVPEAAPRRKVHAATRVTPICSSCQSDDIVSHAVVQWGDAQVLRGSSAIAAAWRTTPPPPPAEGDGPQLPPASLVMLLPAGDGVRVVTVTTRVATMFASRF